MAIPSPDTDFRVADQFSTDLCLEKLLIEHGLRQTGYSVSHDMATAEQLISVPVTSQIYDNIYGHNIEFVDEIDRESAQQYADVIAEDMYGTLYPVSDHKICFEDSHAVCVKCGEMGMERHIDTRSEKLYALTEYLHRECNWRKL